MATLTIRNIDDGLKTRLRVQAARHGRSMEEEVRQILRECLAPEAEQQGLGSLLHRRFAEVGGVELELPERRPARSPDFSGE